MHGDACTSLDEAGRIKGLGTDGLRWAEPPCHCWRRPHHPALVLLLLLKEPNISVGGVYQQAGRLHGEVVIITKRGRVGLGAAGLDLGHGLCPPAGIGTVGEAVHGDALGAQPPASSARHVARC